MSSSEFAELDAAVHAMDRRLVIAAVLGLQIDALAGQRVGIIRQPGWDAAMKTLRAERRMKTLRAERRILLDAARAKPVERSS